MAARQSKTTEPVKAKRGRKALSEADKAIAKRAGLQVGGGSTGKPRSPERIETEAMVAANAPKGKAIVGFIPEGSTATLAPDVKAVKVPGNAGQLREALKAFTHSGEFRTIAGNGATLMVRG